MIGISKTQIITIHSMLIKRTGGIVHKNSIFLEAA